MKPDIKNCKRLILNYLTSQLLFDRRRIYFHLFEFVMKHARILVFFATLKSKKINVD